MGEVLRGEVTSFDHKYFLLKSSNCRLYDTLLPNIRPQDKPKIASWSLPTASHR